MCSDFYLIFCSLLLFACRHHINELVLKTVFESKIKQITSSPDIYLFKKLRENWINIDSSNIEPSLNFVKGHVAESDIQALLMLYKAKLDEGFEEMATVNWWNCA